MNFESRDEWYELLVRIDERTKKIEVDVEEIKENCKEQRSQCNGHIDKKVSWRTFILVVTLFISIIGVIYAKQEVIASDVKDFAKGVEMCDFTQIGGN